MTAEIYRNASGIETLFERLNCGLREIFTTNDSPLQEVTVRDKIRKTNPSNNPYIDQLGPVSVETKVGNWCLTSYPSVTDDWEWGTPIWLANPIFSFDKNPTEKRIDEEKKERERLEKKHEERTKLTMQESLSQMTEDEQRAVSKDAEELYQKYAQEI